jgi:hypothetical protein
LADAPERPRFEFKAVAPSWMLADLMAWLLVQPDGFHVRHPQRRINSIYFDTVDLQRYTENLSGASERSKARLRWYGRDASAAKLVFEAKRKRNKLGWKDTQRIPGRVDMVGTSWRDLNATLRGALRGQLRLVFDMAGGPVLCNSYDREYYASDDDIVRITIDRDIRAYDQRGTDRPNLTRPCLQDDIIVVEVKADAANGDRVAETMATLPLRVTRHSKYAAGVAAILGA